MKPIILFLIVTLIFSCSNETEESGQVDENINLIDLSTFIGKSYSEIYNLKSEYWQYPNFLLIPTIEGEYQITIDFNNYDDIESADITGLWGQLSNQVYGTFVDLNIVEKLINYNFNEPPTYIYKVSIYDANKKETYINVEDLFSNISNFENDYSYYVIWELNNLSYSIYIEGGKLQFSIY
ncbi:hypothetical protein [Saccharicrinis aurantiacus]|uniref:hypothetical protein n=1 Tax=Saccharicrinis aurantiacus TaxID=1849719 RepID=UPI00094FC3C4|nr:hypothetical protein [Saccharicrinis aurantiacus]